MIDEDKVFTLSNPRLLSAAYFAVLAIIATLFMDTLLYLLGVEQIVPLAKAILWAAFIAAMFGALFGVRIVHSHKPYHKHVFGWAFLMVLLALPVYTIGFVFLLSDKHPELFMNVGFSQYVTLYLVVLLYSFILAGIWLAILAGIAAIYLRSHLVYYLLQSLHEEHKSHHETVIHTKTAVHGETTVSSADTIIHDKSPPSDQPR